MSYAYTYVPRPDAPDYPSHRAVARLARDARVPTRAEERILLRRARFGRTRAARQSATDALLSGMTRWVIRRAGYFHRRYRKPDYPDLVQEGLCGVVTAIEHWSFERGDKLRFLTYATHWIDARIRTAVIRNHSMVSGSYSPAARSLIFRGGTDAEVAARLRTTVEHVQRGRARLGCRVDSLDVQRGENERLGDLLPAAEPTVEARLLEREDTRRVQKALLRLPAREQRVLRARFVAGDDAAETLRTLGLRLKISRERVRQIQNEALKRLKDLLERES